MIIAGKKKNKQTKTKTKKQNKKIYIYLMRGLMSNLKIPTMRLEEATE